MSARQLARCWCMVFGAFLFLFTQSVFAQHRIVLRGDEKAQPLAQPSLIADNALAHLVVGVANLDEALKLWVDQLGFELLARQKGADEGLARMWGLQPGRIQDQALIGTTGIRTGRLHLVQYADPLPPVRKGAKPTDLVPKNIDIVCKDLPVRYDELLKGGRKFRSPFVRYKITDHPGEPLDVYEVQMPSHDEVNVVIIEILNINYPFTTKGYAGMTNFIPTVDDGTIEAKFYADVFGLPVLSTHHLEGPELEKMIGLPKGASLDINILGTEDNYFGRIEMVDYKGVESFNRYPQAVPGALGVTHAVVFTPSVAEVKKRAAAAKVKVLDHGEVKAIFGTQAALSVYTPAGLRIDVFERAPLAPTLQSSVER